MSSTKLQYFIYDNWLLFTAAAIIGFGLLMVASASMVISDQQFHTPFHFLFHQFIYLLVGIGCGWFVLRIPLAFWQKSASYLLMVAVLLLVAVLVPGLGREVNGSMRWLGFSAVGFQVSELAKFFVVIYLADFLVEHEEQVQKSLTGFIKPMLVLGMIGILLLLEPDFGTAAVIAMTVLGMLFLAGARLWQFMTLLLLMGGAFSLLAILSPYRLARLTSFLNPWANPFASGYQLTQSLMAFGRGGIFGVGLGNSVQKLFYLPEAHTDFLFAVLAEELGLIGELVVLGLFVFLISRILLIGKTAYDMDKKFAAFLAYGFSLWLGLQAMINIGVNAGVLPTKGLTLPFMSYGGSSMLVNCVVIAILLRINHEIAGARKKRFVRYSR